MQFLADKRNVEEHRRRALGDYRKVKQAKEDQLARLEGTLQALYARSPKLQLAVQPGQIRWRSRPE